MGDLTFGGPFSPTAVEKHDIILAADGAMMDQSQATTEPQLQMMAMEADTSRERGREAGGK